VKCLKAPSAIRIKHSCINIITVLNVSNVYINESCLSCFYHSLLERKWNDKKLTYCLFGMSQIRLVLFHNQYQVPVFLSHILIKLSTPLEWIYLFSSVHSLCRLLEGNVESIRLTSILKKDFAAAVICGFEVFVLGRASKFISLNLFTSWV